MNLGRITLEQARKWARDDKQRDVVVGHKFTGVNARAGVRIDLECQICGHRVSLFPVSAEMVLKRGHLLFCMDCAHAIEASGVPFRKQGRITDNVFVKENGAG